MADIDSSAWFGPIVILAQGQSPTGQVLGGLGSVRIPPEAACPGGYSGPEGPRGSSQLSARRRAWDEAVQAYRLGPIRSAMQRAGSFGELAQ